MLPEYFPQSDGFVQGIVYSNLRDRIDALMDSLYQNGTDPAKMYGPISKTVDAELRAISAAGDRPSASLSDELAAYLVDWYYDEDDDMVQFCVENYRPSRKGKTVSNRSVRTKSSPNRAKGRTSAKPKAKTKGRC